MRTLFSTAAKTAMIAGTALALAACENRTAAVNEVTANELEANMSFDTLGNDASAMEAAGNAATDSAGPANSGNGTDAGDPLGETSGGDTGGNTVESNVSGM